MQGILYRSPRLYGLQRSRWWLAGLRQVVPWLHQQQHLISLPGLCKLLQRLRVSYKRGRCHVHSPDLDYDKKLAVIAQAKEQCRNEPERFVFLYSDELTFFKLPRVGFAYAGTGCKGLKATGTGTQVRRIAAPVWTLPPARCWPANAAASRCKRCTTSSASSKSSIRRPSASTLP